MTSRLIAIFSLLAAVAGFVYANDDWLFETRPAATPAASSAASAEPQTANAVPATTTPAATPPAIVTPLVTAPAAPAPSVTTAPAVAPQISPQIAQQAAPQVAPGNSEKTSAAIAIPTTPAPIEPPPSARAPVEAPLPPVASLTPPAAPEPAVAAPPAEEPEPAPSVAAPEPEKTPDRKQVLAARDLFGAKKLPSIGAAAAIGYYPRGCLSGGVALPTTGPNWQVMRLSRNRNWGHPNLIRFVENFAQRAAKATGWHGVLVGDLSQPRGGPATSGHMSHQTGLDVDIWFMPMPNHKLSREEREDISAYNVVADDWKHINPKIWTPQHIAFIRTAAESAGVERVLVNAAIKKELCRVVGSHTQWLSKVRPWYGHHDHIHVRLACPDGSNNCRAQPPVPESKDDGCGKELDHWFSEKVLRPVVKFKPKKPMTLAELPPECKAVLAAPAKRQQLAEPANRP